jgi:hypothetical protein
VQDEQDADRIGPAQISVLGSASGDNVTRNLLPELERDGKPREGIAMALAFKDLLGELNSAGSRLITGDDASPPVAKRSCRAPNKIATSAVHPSPAAKLHSAHKASRCAAQADASDGPRDARMKAAAKGNSHDDVWMKAPSGVGNAVHAVTDSTDGDGALAQVDEEALGTCNACASSGSDVRSGSSGRFRGLIDSPLSRRGGDAAHEDNISMDEEGNEAQHGVAQVASNDTSVTGGAPTSSSGDDCLRGDPASLGSDDSAPHSVGNAAQWTSSMSERASDGRTGVTHSPVSHGAGDSPSTPPSADYALREEVQVTSSPDDATRVTTSSDYMRRDGTSESQLCSEGTGECQPMPDEVPVAVHDAASEASQVVDQDVTEGEEVRASTTEEVRGGEVTNETTPEALQTIRAERIERAQQEETWAAHLRVYRRGKLDEPTESQIESCAKRASVFEEVNGLPYYEGARTARGGASTASGDAAGAPEGTDQGRNKELHLRLVIPTTSQSELLHHYHRSLNGGHQGVARTFERVKAHTYWTGQYQSVRNYVAACPDCQSGKGAPRLDVGSPGNVEATRPFEVLGMDHVPSLPKSTRGNTELLIWIDQHTGYVIVSANASRKAETAAEAYERCVYRRFGASRIIRHDREPAFMSEVFRAFNRLIGQRSRATLAYRPQANGMTERMVQTMMHAVRLYVSHPQQRDWDDYAERLVFALNTAHDRVRQETPFYLLHGWDPYSTIETNLRERGHVQARKWRAQVQAKYRQAREDANRLLKKAREVRMAAANENARGGDEAIVPGARVWLYADQVKPGFARKLAHLWHGPFRVLERLEPHLVRLEMDSTDYRMHPVVHVSRLKLWRVFEARPVVQLQVQANQRFDFDEGLLPEDSFDPRNEDDEYEITEI